VASASTMPATAALYASRLSGRLLKKSASNIRMLLGANCGESVRQDVADLIHLFGRNDQWRQQAQHGAAPAPHFENQAALEAFSLNLPRKFAGAARPSGAIGLFRVNDLYAEH